MPTYFKSPTYSLVDMFEDDDDSVSEIFQEYTKINRTNVTPLSDRVDRITSDEGLLAMTMRSWKSYPGAAIVQLPHFDPPQESFASVVARRRSVSSNRRNFLPGPVSLEAISGMLAMAYGPTGRIQSKNGEDIQFLRATASAGGLYPCEMYLLAFNVEGLEPGKYHYRPTENSLEVLHLGDFLEDFVGTASYPGLAKSAAAAIVITTMTRRTVFKYRHRGYRFAIIDVGGLCQQLYLTGTAMGMETCALGGFFDDEAAALLDLNSVQEPVQIVFLVGPGAPAEA